MLLKKALAEELTLLVHKGAGLAQAKNITEVLFGGDIKSLAAQDIKIGLKDAPKFILEEPMNLTDLLVSAKIASSKREAREFIKGKCDSNQWR